MTGISQERTAEPPYRRIETDLRVRLRRGDWTPGTLLPSRRTLAREYGVALRTMERAISGLLTEGLLRAEGRWGTFASGKARPEGWQRSLSVPPVSASALTATLGLLDTNSLYTHNPRQDEFGWIDTIATHAERTFAAAGGRTHYFRRFETSGGRVPVREAVAGLQEEGITALLVIGIFDTPPIMQEVIAALADVSFPAVYISWEDIAAPLPYVFYDNVIAGMQAAQHLRRSGYGEIFYFAPFVAPWAEERLAGLRRALPQAIAVFPAERTPDSQIADWDNCRTEVRAMLTLCTGRPPALPPVGIVAANDTLAHLILDAAEECGLTPGRDFGVMGFDDQPRSRLRGLTTLHPPLEALGEQASRMLLNRLRGDGAGSQVRLRSHLLPRASTHRA